MQNSQSPVVKVTEPHEGAETGLDIIRPSYRDRAYWGEMEGADENHLREYLRAIRKHVWLIIGIALLSVALSAVYVSRQPDLYSAQARVQVDLENNPASGIGKSGTIVISGPTADPAYFNTQLQVLTGSGLLRRVVKTLDLEHNESFTRPNKDINRSTWQNLTRMVGFKPDSAEKHKEKQQDNSLPLTSNVAPATARDDFAEARRLEPFVRMLQGGLSVEPVKETRTSSYTKDTRLIDVRFTSTDPQLAAKIVNAVADSFVLSNLERKTETTNNTGDFLQKRVAELQSDIRSGEERLLNYAKSNQILPVEGSDNPVVARLTELNKQLLEAENDRKNAEAAYRAATAPGAANSLAEDSKDGNKQLADIQAEIAGLKKKREQLLIENTEEWPEVKEVTQQIATLEKQLSEVRTRATSTLTTNLETRYRQTLDRERALRADFDRQRGQTLDQNAAGINYRIVQQEIETNKQLLDGLLQKSKENDVVMAGTSNNIFVVDYALSPGAPIGPQRSKNIVMALFLGLTGGIGLAIFLEYLNDSIRSTDDVDRWLHLPSMGVIPVVTGTKKRRLLPSAGTLQRASNGNGSPELLVNAESRSALAESYRHLRTSILLSTAGRAPKSLLVTSTMPSEGKTTTAVNTAISLAQTGASVLVIDADLRRPRLHNIFGIGNHRGLSTILSSEMSEAEVMSLIEVHEETGLHVLTSGAIPPNPAELLGSEQMRNLVKMLEGTFTHIIIDTPPVGSFTDGVLAATLVDGVLLVIHSGRTSRNVAKRTRQILQDVGAKIFGVVLNNVNLREHDYYYYKSYYSQYYSTEQQGEEVASVSEV